MTFRLGATLPLDGVPLYEHKQLLDDLVRSGYTDIWTSEVASLDGLMPLSLFAAWQPGVRLGCGVVSAFTRGPAVLAMSAAALAEAAPGRAVLGIGAGSRTVVSSWNGIAYEHPYQRVEQTLRFLRTVLSGERAVGDYGTLGARGFRLGRVPDAPPSIMIGGLGPRMLRLAGAEADILMLNWLSAGDLRTVLGEVNSAGRTLVSPLEVHVRIFVVPIQDPEAADLAARRHITGYLTVPAYARYQRWLGRGAALKAMWEAWDAGDRKRAVNSVPSDVVRALVVTGTPAECATEASRYLDAGADSVSLFLVHGGGGPPDGREQVGFLADVATAITEADSCIAYLP